MSVLIKGMEMPHDCDSCKVSDILDCTLWKPMDIGERHPECPLVEVPTLHGDLIDRKVLIDAVLKWMPPDPCGREEKEFPFDEDICASMMMEIEEQPTVIEAEDE